MNGILPGFLLMAATLAALAWANSPFAASYQALLETKLGVVAGDWRLVKPSLLWINDGLMAIFFFYVGLEIKREVVAGELSSPRKAALSIVAALGGMLVPAALYRWFNDGTPTADGWGVPMATDIAFTLGVLAVLGSRAPAPLKIFVTALAIVDDLAAVVVIAVFYTDKIDATSLALSLGLWLAVLVAGRMGMRALWMFFVPGVAVWLTGLLSGVHATIAGVLMALAIPIDADGEPLTSLEHALHPWVSFAILPVFALANAGVPLAGGEGSPFSQPATLGIFAGLVVGKPLGIAFFCWIAVRLGLATLPSGVGWRDLVGAGCLCGIGFTMSLFIASLAFDDRNLSDAKLAILIASAASAGLGAAVLAARSRVARA